MKKKQKINKEKDKSSINKYLNSNSIDSVDSNIFLDENSTNVTITEFIKYRLYEGVHNRIVRKIMLDGSYDNLYDFKIMTSDLKLIKSTITTNCDDKKILKNSNENEETQKQIKLDINSKYNSIMDNNKFSINNLINKFEVKSKQEYICINIQFEEFNLENEKIINIGIKYVGIGIQ